MALNITIIGAGAMGCLIGGRLARGGHALSFIARGRQLAALRDHGLTLNSEQDHWHGAVRATDDATTLGAQDAVILCTKAYQLEGAVAHLAPLMDANTLVVPAVNGVPWWYFNQHGGEFDGRQLTNLDPSGVLAREVDTARIIGCVNYLAGTLTQPGHVHYVHELERRIVLGELNGAITPRLERLASAFADGGFAPVVTEDIRQSIWHKLWGNIAFNPISALTHGTIDQIALGYHDIDLVTAVMNEARNIADKLGIALAQTTKSRVEAAAKMRGHKTSMLVDIEQGRPTEIEAIVGAVREIGRWMEENTPHLNTLYSLVKLKERFYSPSVDTSGHA
jgi:2-dehydropantoate 2-reductase